MAAKKFNKDKFVKACKAENMDDEAIEKACKKAEDAMEDDGDADDLEKGDGLNPETNGGEDKEIKKAMDALSDLEDKIQKGEFKFTQADVDAIEAQGLGKLEGVLAQHAAFDGKVIDRLGCIEKGFLGLFDLVKSVATEQAAKLADLDVLVKALPAVKAEDKLEGDEVVDADALKKGISGDNEPVDKVKGVTTEVKSPMDDKPEDTMKKGQYTVGQIGDMARKKLQDDKGKYLLTPAVRKELSDVLMKSSSGVSGNALLRDHAKVLGLA